jgi:hypothetical protein
MKVYKITKKVTLAFYIAAIVYGLNAYAQNCLDCHSLIEKAANLEVIKSKIKGFGLEEKKDELNPYHLKTGDYGECKYSIEDGRLLVRRALVEGKIKNIDLEKKIITLEGCEILGNKPLRLSKDSVCYIGDEKADIVSISGGAKFHKGAELSLDHLKAGDYVKCNYSIRDGKFWAVRIVLITPYRRPEVVPALPSTVVYSAGKVG